MAGGSPYWYMKEFADNKDLVQILVNKIRETQTAKAKADELNIKLQDNMIRLEEVQAELAKQRDLLQEEVKNKTNALLKVERLSAIGQLSARIAHDLRNPLSVIQGTSQILRIRLGGQLDQKNLELWDRMDRAINRMSHQIEDVMDYVRVSPLQKRDYSLGRIIQDVIERITIPEDVTIHTPKNNCVVFCDPEKLEIVFVNLIVNAIQALDGKKGNVTVDISDDQAGGDFATIKISDTGIGIPQENIEKIFEPLYTTKQVGTGLGLSSCKNIIEQHDGTISVSSVVGSGTTFTIRIPKKQFHR